MQAQVQNDKKCIIAYVSKKLNKLQLRYSVTERGLQNLRSFLIGTEFFIFTEHRALI